VSGELKMAVEGPSREFVVAAEQLAKAAKTGSTQFAKVAAAVENMQESGFDRIENVQRQQLETLRQETDAIGQLRLLLSRAEDLRVTDWNASFTAAAESAETMKQSMASVVETLRARTEEFQIGLGGSTDAVRSAMKRLEGSMGDFEARCRLASEAVAATSLKSDEIIRVRDGMRELADALASTLRSIQSPVGANSLRGTGFPWFRSGSSS